MDCQLLKQGWQAVAVNLAINGFARFDSSLFDHEWSHLDDARTAFAASCDNLPPDPFSEMPGRNWRYGQFTFHPAAGTIDVISPVWDRDRKEYITYYQQQGCFNPEHPGERRGFAALTEKQSSNAFLRSLIIRCFFALPWKANCTVLVGVHIIEFHVRPGRGVVSTPINLHCDGEPFTWAFLIARADVIGGENIIATSESCGRNPNEIPIDDVRARFTLKKPLDGWVVDDFEVSHYVSPVTVADGAAVGRRVMLLVDFTPATSNYDTLASD